MTILLRVVDLCIGAARVRGPETRIVRNVSFDLARGEVVGLIGESGSGKSTLALATMGYTRPGCSITGGHVLMNSTDILALEQRELQRWRGYRIGYIAQSAIAAFNPSLKIATQMTEGPVVHGLMTRRAAAAHTIDLCRQMDLPNPETIGQRYPHQVSGGQLQRLLAIMAVSCGPELLVLDEPTTALDVTTQIEVLKTLRQLIKAKGTSALYVTHDLAVVAQIADRIVVLRDGKIVEQGKTDEIIFAPREPYTRRLMAAIRPSPRSQQEIGPARAAQNAGSGADRRAALIIEDANAGYGGGPGRRPQSLVLKGIDLAIPQGKIVGVIGESGSGKSSLARMISGLLPQCRGRMLLAGNLLPARVADRERGTLRQIQLVTQTPDLAFNPMTQVGQILERPLKFYFNMPKMQRVDRVKELLNLVALPADYARRFPFQLSGGEKQRVNLARALAAEPTVLLCDEVTSALDTIVTTHIMKLIQTLQKNLSISLILISHDISTIAACADRIAVLYAGRIVQEGPTAAVISAPYHPYTRMLLDSMPEMRPGWLDEAEKRRTIVAASATAEADPSSDKCAFHFRCPMVIPGTCDQALPPNREVEGPRSFIACHRHLPELGE